MAVSKDMCRPGLAEAFAAGYWQVVAMPPEALLVVAVLPVGVGLAAIWVALARRVALDADAVLRAGTVR